MLSATSRHLSVRPTALIPLASGSISPLIPRTTNSRHRFHIAPRNITAPSCRFSTSLTSRQSVSHSISQPKVARYHTPRQADVVVHQTIKKSRINSHYSQAPRLYKSQLSPTYLLIGVVVGFIGSVFAYLYNSDSDTEQEEVQHPKPIISDGKMVMLPGRPGNLTPEEELKLKQFWRLTFSVTGVDAGDDPSLESQLPDTASTTNADASTLSGEKNRKSGIFGRKRKESKIEASAAEGDKYGQTAEYKEAIATTTPEEFRRAFWANSKNEHPDAILLRFLRARKWDLQKALVMMISTLQWRAKEMHIEDEIVFKGELTAFEEEKYSQDKAIKQEASDFLAQIRKGKSYVHGVDREGRPVTWVRVRLHHGGEQSVTSIERFTVQIFETTRLLIEPPADTGDLFFDMTGFGVANMDYTPVKFMIKCFEANYPESLGACIIYKAPWIFQGFWKIISRWLDPVVASKIHFADKVKDLEPWVDRSQVPKEMGGESPYNYNYIEPIEGENDLMKDTVTRGKLEAERTQLGQEFEELTVRWINGANVAAERQALAVKMNQQYWKLDPYIRARTLYDRLGVLNPDGVVDWSRALNPKTPEKRKPYANGSAPGGNALVGAVQQPVPNPTSQAKDVDSDNESLASFRTAKNWDDDRPKTPNGVVTAPISNGAASNGVAKAGIAGGGIGAVAVGLAAAQADGAAHHGSPVQQQKAPSQQNSVSRAPSTPTKHNGLADAVSPARSTYSNAGTQTWNPKDASTQTMPQTLPIRSR